MAALNIHIIHAPALNLAPAPCSLPFFLVATGCHDCPVEIYPQERGLPNCRGSGNACYALACSGPYWAYGADLGAGVPCLGAEFGFVGAVSAAGGADVALPCILHLYNPGSYITPFWGPHYVRHRQLDQPFYFVLCTQAPFHDLDFEVE